MGAADVAIAYALAQIGKPYVWATAGPDSFDCSGLVYAAYRAAGVPIPRTTYQQILVGQHIAQADLAPGDLVFPYPDFSHVQLYIGGGQVVESPHTGATVRKVGMYGFAAARRYVAPGAAVTSPGAVGMGGGTSATLVSDPLGISTTADKIMNEVGWFLEAIAGGLILVGGVVILLVQTEFGKRGRRAVTRGRDAADQGDDDDQGEGDQE